jgi:excinuclease UvrABC ATPase subunit
MGTAIRTPPVTPVSRTVSVIKCYKCQYAEVRDFQKGDYMYKTVGKCKDCQGDMYIRSIYTVPIQKM